MALDERSKFRFNISHKHDFDFNKQTFQDFSHINALGINFDFGRKVGHGQPRIIIYAILVGPTTTMLHTKSQGQWPSGSGGECFKGVLPYMGMVCTNFG